MYYLLDKKSVLNGQPIVRTMSTNEIEESLKNENTIEYVGEYIPSFVGIANGVVVETDLYDYFKRGLYTLEYGEYDDGTKISFYNPILEKVVNKNKIPKTNNELKLDGVISMEYGDFVVDNDVKNIYQFHCPKEFVKPVFDYENLIWVESATEQEIESHMFEIEIELYNIELNYAGKANTELACGVITQEEFNDVSLYISSINPYKKKSRTKRALIERPLLFDRYR